LGIDGCEYFRSVFFTTEWDSCPTRWRRFWKSPLFVHSILSLQTDGRTDQRKKWSDYRSVYYAR